MQSLMDQVKQEDSDEDSQEWPPPTLHTPFQPHYDNKIKWVRKIRENMRCMLKRGRLRSRTKKLKIEAWVNDLMITNTSMTIPPINWFTVMAMPNKTSTPRNDNISQMDTDSATIGIDNRCTLCILHISEYFVGELRKPGRNIRGFVGVIQPKIKTGTLLWRCEDDQGQEYKFLIPNYLFIPSGKCRLLSPQHLAQTRQYDQKQVVETTDR